MGLTLVILVAVLAVVLAVVILVVTVVAARNGVTVDEQTAAKLNARIVQQRRLLDDGHAGRPAPADPAALDPTYVDPTPAPPPATSWRDPTSGWSSRQR